MHDWLSCKAMHAFKQKVSADQWLEDNEALGVIYLGKKKTSSLEPIETDIVSKSCPGSE